MDGPSGQSTEDPPDGVDVGDVFDQLADLEETVTTTEQRAELDETRRLIEQLPGGERISKFTSRDLGEAFVGSIVFALPLLVEDGVFVIADHFLEVFVAGVPVVLVANTALVVGLTAGLIYGVDIREVRVTNPILGVLPRRLVGVLAVSFLTSAGLMALWGRLFLDDPTQLGVVARITVVWAAAALGASLGDILPGESQGYDLRVENIDEIIDFDDEW